MRAAPCGDHWMLWSGQVDARGATCACSGTSAHPPGSRVLAARLGADAPRTLDPPARAAHRRAHLADRRQLRQHHGPTARARRSRGAAHRSRTRLAVARHAAHVARSRPNASRHGARVRRGAMAQEHIRVLGLRGMVQSTSPSDDTSAHRRTRCRPCRGGPLGRRCAESRRADQGVAIDSAPARTCATFPRQRVDPGSCITPFVIPQGAPPHGHRRFGRD